MGKSRRQRDHLRNCLTTLKLTEDCHEILRKQTSFTFSRHNLVILNLQHVIAYIYEFDVQTPIDH